MNRYKSVDEYIDDAEYWRDELILLRAILNATDLEEDVKWGGPCYTYNGKNVVGMGAFKAYFGLWFFQGVLLADTNKVLVNAQEGKTKALRQWRFQHEKEIRSGRIKAYVKEAIALQERGLEIAPDRSRPVELPPEFMTALDKSPRAKKRFKSMTKGKQREYADYIMSAKRDDTKVKRLEKIIPMIAAGSGLNDKYRNG